MIWEIENSCRKRKRLVQRGREIPQHIGGHVTLLLEWTGGEVNPEAENKRSMSRDLRENKKLAELTRKISECKLLR